MCITTISNSHKGDATGEWKEAKGSSSTGSLFYEV
jgi:hypothetical protein